MPERVVVAQVAIEAADVSDELLPLVLGQALDTLHSARLKFFKIFVSEVGLEDAPDER